MNVRPRRRLAAALVALAAVPAAVALVRPPSAAADYAAVGDGLVEWAWARSAPDTHQVADIAVRPDGWLVVATPTGADGHLHLVPPWGGTVDDSNRFGPSDLGFRQLEVARGRLFGLRQETLRTDVDVEDHPPGELFELDIRTGAVVRELGRWWFQDLATDPVTGELVLQTSGERTDPYRHDLVRFDPDTGATTMLRSDGDPRADDALEVAYSDDGRTLYVARPTGTTTEVLDRDGGTRFSMQLGPADTIVAGRSGTCHEGQLLLTRFDGSVLSVRPTGATATARVIASGGPAGVVSYATTDNRGNLVVARLGEVLVLGCPGFVPPLPPAPAAPVAAAPSAPAPAAAGPTAATGPPTPTPPAPGAAPTGTPTPPAAPTGSPPPAPPPAPPTPPAPPAPLGVPSALGPAMQAGAAPSVGVADVPDHEHLTSLAAARADGPDPRVLLYGAAVTMTLAAAALSRPRPVAGTAPATRPTGAPR